MDNVEEIIQALFIGIAVASVLLQTYRYSKAIELFSECLVLLKKHSTKLKKEKLNELYALVYRRLFSLYCFVGDQKNAIQSGEKAFHLYHQIGDSESAAGLLDKIGDVYQLTGEQVKAKEIYEKAFALYFNEIVKVSEMPFVKQRKHFERMLSVATKIGDNGIVGGLLYKLGDLSLSLFEYPQAKDYFQRELAIRKETGNRKNEGRTLDSLGKVYRKMEEYEQAKQHYEEAMVILEEAGEIKKLGATYGELGKVCNILGEFPKAKALQKKALEISKKIGDKEGENTDYRYLAGVHISLGECDEAKECYHKALAISKEVGDRKGEALTYSDQGFFYQSLNDYKKAENYCKKAREIYKEIGDIQKEGSENSELGSLYMFLGRYDEARKCHERALAIDKQIGDRRGEGLEYCNLGTVYQSLGDYGKAKEYHEQALAISKETDHFRGQGVDHGNLGTVYQFLGDYDTAYEHHKKALEIKIRTGHKEGLPTDYNHLGNVCQHRGEYAMAKKYWKKALTSANEIGDRRSEAKVLTNLASLEQIIGESKKAKVHYEEALKISKEIGDIRQEAEMNCNLGTVYQSLGDFTMAKKYLAKSLAIIKLIGSKDVEGTVYGNLGCVHSSLGEYAKAREFYQKALAISRETGDKKGEMTMNNNLGILYLSQNKFEKASECFKRALSICTQTGDLREKSMSYCNLAMVCLRNRDMPKTLSYLSESIKTLEKIRVSIGESEYYKIGFADQHVHTYLLMAVVLLKLGDIKRALSISELGRARSLAELMASQYSTQHLPGFDPDRWIDFENVVQKKSCTCLSFCFWHDLLFCWILKANRKVMFKEVETKGVSTDIPTQGLSILDWLEKLKFQLLLQGERCEDRSLFVWDEARSPSHVEERPTVGQVTEHEKEGQKEPSAFKALYKITIAPVADLLEGSEIIVVPDRSLYRVPFAALMDESGEYLSEKFKIRFIPSLATLKLIQDSPADYHSQTGVLIVGDPEVGLTELGPLPCAREEVEMIGRLLHVHPLTGKQATKQTVLQKIHSVGLIHIAAHGNADRGDIALAPAQHIKGIPKKEDFMLTMSDISKVQLRAKLVVLSCCHSGRGQIKSEGVVGIARAFLGSGARSVLVSLWAVEDNATMQFMKQFYGHLVRGESASQSLHETMKWMRGNPQYCEVRQWAPFMLIGDDVSFNFPK